MSKEYKDEKKTFFQGKIYTSLQLPRFHVPCSVLAFYVFST